MIRLSSFLFFLILISSCTRGGNPSAHAVVVRVDSDVLTASQFAEQLATKMKHHDAAAAKLATNVNRAKADIIQNFLVLHTVKKYAKANNLSITEEEFEAAFNKIRMGYKDDLTFKSSLASSGLLVDDWKKDFKNSLLQKKVFEHITEKVEIKRESLIDEAKKYFLSHSNLYQLPAGIRLSQIVVSKHEEAEKIQKFLRSGSYSFQDMAKKYSLSPDAKNGGDIGYISKGAVPDFDIAFTLPVGQLSGIIKSNYGYHLMKVTARRNASKTSFEQAKAEIIKMLEEQKKQEYFSQWLLDNLKGAKVEKNEAIIEKIKVYTEGTKD